MQSTGPHTDVEDKANAKVYISNINKNIDEQTLRAKFEQFGPIRSCILKKKPNDVTYSFIQYERAADAALAISQLNSTIVWERNLKVQYGLGGKKGFQHYLSDAQRDRKFGESRFRRTESEESPRKYRPSYDNGKREYRKKSNSRDSIYERSYSPIRNKERRRSRSRRRDSRERIRPSRDSRDRAFRDHRGRGRDSYSIDSRDSYHRQRRHRERRQRQHRRREDYRKSDSRSSQMRRRSREKIKRYEPFYKDEYFEKRSFDKIRQPENYQKYNSRERAENSRRFREMSPPYDKDKKYSPRPKLRPSSRSESEQRRKSYRNQRVQRYQKTRGQTRQRYQPREKKNQQKFLQKRQQSKRREKYDALN